MNPQDTPSLEHAMETPFDKALGQHFQREAEPDDEGFSQRVMAALPPHAARRRVRWAEWALHAQWSAISVAACGVAALLPIGDDGAAVTHTIAAYTLLGLLIFWAIPSRWSRGQ